MSRPTAELAPLAAMMKPLHGRRALVVGGDGDIGREISTGLAADGADVTIASLDEPAARTLATELSAMDVQASGRYVDITDPDSVDTLVRDLVRDGGSLDVLVNCAGLLQVDAAERMDPAVFRRVVDVNLTGAFLISQRVGQAMIGHGGGRIVHLSSVRATIGLAIGGFVAYGASKAGVHLLVRQLAAEWGRHGIAVNGVAAGFVRAGVSARALANEDYAAMVAARTPLGRVAEVTEVANAAVYLAGPRASFVTGQMLFVDGGLSATQ